MPGELRHERLTEPHDLRVAPALRIEVRASLAAAEREGRQRVLEDLLEREELQHPERDGWMEAQTALVRAESAVHLHPDAAVHVDLARVVGPGDAEQDHALGLEDPLQDPALAVARVVLENGAEAREDLLDGLVEVRLARIPGYQVVEEVLDVSGHVCSSSRGAHGAPPGSRRGPWHRAPLTPSRGAPSSDCCTARLWDCRSCPRCSTARMLSSHRGAARWR